MSSPWPLGFWIIGDNPCNSCAFDGRTREAASCCVFVVLIMVPSRSLYASMGDPTISTAFTCERHVCNPRCCRLRLSDLGVPAPVDRNIYSWKKAIATQGRNGKDSAQGIQAPC